ncbi:hypothetical protein MTBLM1_30162 [Rhodospirillaceae bacterium LM-1]|nr:hypothetical protein MTBLM1_30162 [Rhodospirillaceae bacterium LM-1]
MTNKWNEPDWAKLGDEAVRFFYWFSRFEYVLKKEGYTKPDQENAEPDRDSFAKKGLTKKFFDNIKDKPTADILFKKAPRKQIVLSDGKLGWCPKEPDFPTRPDSIQTLFVYIRRIRNNLFHGGKVPGGLDVRDKELINAAQYVLEQALENAPKEVQDAFKNPSDSHG